MITSPKFYDLKPDQREKLSGLWCASYSGGKDSTSLVTWIEWLRRSGKISVDRPQLVQSDTGVEYPILTDISAEMMTVLRRSGWECVIVHPKIQEKLYNRILGHGLTPIHPGGRKMRWCTRSTKIDPMKRWRRGNSSGLTLTGVRLGESAIRDGKLLKKIGCSAGGECGVPDIADDTYGPIIHWSTCNVIGWITGEDNNAERRHLTDILPLTKRLIDIYEVKFGDVGFVDVTDKAWVPPQIKAARFGCNGCPAIEASDEAPRSVVSRNGPGSPFNEIYAVWHEARKRINRLRRVGHDGAGPIKMAVRKILFERIMDIQRRAGVMLINLDDQSYIRGCWARNIYPRGWSAEDELTCDALADEYDTPLISLTVKGT